MLKARRRRSTFGIKLPPQGDNGKQPKHRSADVPPQPRGVRSGRVPL